MKNTFVIKAILLTFLSIPIGCKKMEEKKEITAAEILGNPNYPAMSYGGYRHANHDIEPTIQELKEDMLLLHAMGIRVLRTYKVHLPHAANVLQAIKELKQEKPNFEMYVMLGAWIDCKNAWTNLPPIHHEESDRNAIEIKEAVRLAKAYPQIVKVIAVGNEAMVKWAASYYVQPWIILKWVNHLQELKKSGELPKDLWITSSDNFASWGGGDAEYHVPELNELINAVDFLSVHTYPMHDTHYNPQFWGVGEEESHLTKKEKITKAMDRALEYAKNQYQNVVDYARSIGVEKPVHIGETGWASFSNELYGDEGSMACDEFKEGLYYQAMRQWTHAQGISCFYFEAFDEPWKGGSHPGDSEKHFGLFTVEGQAKYALWSAVDEGIFDGLSRNGNPITKTYGGEIDSLMLEVKVPPMMQAELVNH